MTIADNLTSIYNCKKDIKASIIGKGVAVGDDLTTYAAAITSIQTGSAGVISLGKPEIITINPFDSSIKAIQPYAMRTWTAPTGLIIGEGIETIGDYAFNGWSGALSLTLPSTLKSIGQHSFSNMTSLNIDLIVPNSVTSISSNSFNGNSSMIGIKIGDNVASLPTGVLAGCSSIKTIEMGSGITSIAANFLTTGVSVQTITITATTPPTMNASGAFMNMPSNAQIKVPSASVAAYKAATGWSVYASQIVAI